MHTLAHANADARLGFTVNGRRLHPEATPHSARLSHFQFPAALWPHAVPVRTPNFQEICVVDLEEFVEEEAHPLIAAGWMQEGGTQEEEVEMAEADGAEEDG